MGKRGEKRESVRRRIGKGYEQRRTVVPMQEMKPERKELKGKEPTMQAYPKRMAAVVSAKTMKASMMRNLADFSAYDLEKDVMIEPREVIAVGCGWMTMAGNDDKHSSAKHKKIWAVFQ